MRESDLKFMKKAIEESSLSKSKDESDPKVGAVVVKNEEFINSAHRGEKGKGDHAEFTVLYKKIRSKDVLNGATLYTTLEPCTQRSHDKLQCVEWIVKYQIGRVVIGILDPNPNICGKGYWRLLEANIQVDFFPSELAKKIIEMNKSFIQLHHGGKHYDASLAWFIEHNKSPLITAYPGLGWGDDLTLQICPTLRDGWPLSKVEIHHDDSKWFQLPKRYRTPYKSYFTENYDSLGFYEDGEKFMLMRNPIAFSDAPTLKLRTIRCRYSQTCYYNDNITTIAARLNPLIHELVKGSLDVKFPHTLCMHMIVVTNDNKILITKRSPKVYWNPKTWSCSIEEQLARSDFENGPKMALQKWSIRMLDEELGVDKEAYNTDNLRLLSVFLETDCLGISLCVYAELNINSATLDSIIKGHPRTDDEFTEWTFLDFKPAVLLKELIRPTREYHPSTDYRMLMALLKQFGTKELKKALPL